MGGPHEMNQAVDVTANSNVKFADVKEEGFVYKFVGWVKDKFTATADKPNVTFVGEWSKTAETTTTASTTKATTVTTVAPETTVTTVAPETTVTSVVPSTSEVTSTSTPSTSEDKTTEAVVTAKGTGLVAEDKPEAKLPEITKNETVETKVNKAIEKAKAEVDNSKRVSGAKVLPKTSAAK